MEALKLYWLGSPLVELKGRAVKLETRKAAAMVAYLSLAPGECQREILATMFWPEGSQQKALANLRRTLSSLNSTLPGWIKANRETITLKRNVKLWVDVEVFHQSLCQLKEHPHPANQVCEACLSVLENTANLYRGDFLEGLNLKECPSFDEWQFFGRDELRQELANVLQHLSSGHGERGQWDQAIKYARRWVALDHLSEPACRVLMDLYARSGQRTAALHQYEEMARLLREQMAQPPESETRKLYEQIRSRGVIKHVDEAAERPTRFPLLKTKLHIPSAPAPRVVRSDLITRLAEVEKKAFTIISAPAGFGKTTLLAEWIEQTTLPVAWFSLDSGDNDPYRFLSYLIEALEGIQEDAGLEARQMMQSPELAPPHIILTSLINNLGRTVEPSVLILDDYQFIDEHAVHQIMGYLLDHLPSTLHVVLATRADPPLQLGRLRVHDQLLELRTHDLRFNHQEAVTFLNDVMRLGLSASDIYVLDTRTEGWVVGLKMAALSLKGHENASKFIRDFSGSHRYVLDYLVEEVLKRQPAHIQSFLFETSILEKLNGPLCDALLTEQWRQSGESGQAVLEYLERNNLFLIPLDDHKQWYRYHHLFAQLLYSRATQMSGITGIKILHQRAAAWYKDQGMLEETIFHASAAQDYWEVAHLIEQNLQSMLAHGEYEALLKWINALPEEVIDSRPWLQTHQARILGILNRTREMEPILQKLEQRVRQNRDNDEFLKISTHISYLRAVAAFKEADLDQALCHVSLAKGQTKGEDLEFLNNLMLLFGSIHLALGNLQEATRAFSEVTKSLPTIRSLYGLLPVFSAMVNLADIHVIRGELDKAETLYHHARNIAVQWGDPQFHILGRVFISLGNLLYQRNILEMAIRYIRQGVDHYQKWGHASDMANGYASLARALHASGKTSEAKAVMKKALDETNRSSAGIKATNFVKRQQFQLMLKNGDRWQGEEWLQETDLKTEEPIILNNEQDHILRARILIKQKKYSAASSLLKKIAKAAQRGSRNGSLIEIFTLQALALRLGNQTDEAFQVMMKALQLAESEGYIRIFLDEGNSMIQLLRDLRGSSLDSQIKDYIDRLLEASTQR